MFSEDSSVFEDVQPNIVIESGLVVGTDPAIGKDQTVFTAIDPSGHVITVSSEDIRNASYQPTTVW